MPFNMADKGNQEKLLIVPLLVFQNKLDGYIKDEQDGKELTSEQEKAVAKYEEVVQQLSLSKEFCKQFNVVATAASKEAKRDARKVSDSSALIQPAIAYV